MSLWPTMPSSSSERQAWAFFDHFRKAIDERAQALGRRHFPREPHTWYEGTVESLVIEDGEIHLYETGQTWSPPLAPPFPDDFPTNFDVVIEPTDDTKPWELLRLQLAAYAHDVLGLTGLNFAHPDTLDLSNYNGRRYRIITGHAFPSSPDWTQRIMQWSNEWPAEAVVITAKTDTTLTDASKAWETNAWAGYHVVLDDTHNTRAVIASNTSDTLTLDRTVASEVGQRVAIVALDKVFDWSREDAGAVNASYPYQWANLPAEAYWSRAADGSAAAADMVKEVVDYIYVNGAGETTHYPADPQDVDIWTDLQWNGELPDRNFTPFRYRTWRGIQEAVESLVNFDGDVVFVKSQDYTGKKSIPRYTLATALPNGHDYEMTGGSSIDITADVPYLPIFVCYTITDPAADGDVIEASNWVEVGTDGELNLGGPVGTEGSPKDVRVTWGWTRLVAREFINFYPCTGFVPDWNATAGELVVPPTEEYPGTWLTRPASTRYRYCDGHGHVFDSPHACDDVESSKLARYVGGNFYDASIRTPARQKKGGAQADAIAEYLVVFVEGVDDLQRSGTVVDGGDFWIETDADWWEDNGVMIEHAGTASGGSTTSLSDSTKAASAFWTHPEKGRWLGWIIEIHIAGVWHRRLITSHTGDTVGWDEELPATADGCSYTLREPSKFARNRWKHRTLRLTRPDGTSVDAFIYASDDTHVFFEPIDGAAEAGWKWEILEAGIGTTWMATDNGEGGFTWEVPDPETYPADTRKLPPDTLTRYGRFTKGDYGCETLFVEVRDVLNKLTATRRASNWTNKGESNQKHVGIDFTDTWPTYLEAKTDMLSIAQGQWDTSDTVASGPPMFRLEITVGGDPPYRFSNTFLDGRYAYGQATNVPTFLAGTADFYGLAHFGESEIDPPTIPSPDLYAFRGDYVPTPSASAWTLKQWNKFDSAAVAGGTVESAKVGDLDWVTFAPESFFVPDATQLDLSFIHSCYIAQTCVVVRWDMQYVE